MNEPTPWYQKAWKFILGAFLLLTGAFLWQKRRAEDAEGELISSKTKVEDAALAEREKIAKEQADAERAKLEELTKSTPSVESMTPDQVKEYWKNK